MRDKDRNPFCSSQGDSDENVLNYLLAFGSKSIHINDTRCVLFYRIFFSVQSRASDTVMKGFYGLDRKCRRMQISSRKRQLEHLHVPPVQQQSSKNSSRYRSVNTSRSIWRDLVLNLEQPLTLVKLPRWQQPLRPHNIKWNRTDSSKRQHSTVTLHIRCFQVPCEKWIVRSVKLQNPEEAFFPPIN